VQRSLPFKRFAIPPSVLAGFAAFLVAWILSHGRSTPYNNYVLLAQAFLHGHLAIDWPGAYIDALAYHGAHYVIEAPLPAILLVPFVALFGSAANQTLLACALGGLAIGALWRIGEHYGLEARANAWVAAFAFAGTDLLWASMLGDVWFIANVSAFAFALLLWLELRTAKRGWLVALYLAAAVESRFSLVVIAPLVLALLLASDDAALRLHPAWRSRLVGFVGVALPVIALWVAYNFARWGTWDDIGYSMWFHQDPAGSPYGSPFALRYLSYQLQSFFLQMPTVLSGFPYLRPEMTGVALTWTSPALVLVAWARKPLRDTVVLWLMLLATWLPNLVYYVNGFAQFGMRHALDFEPFAAVLLLLALRRGIPRWGYPLMLYSVLVGLWGCWYWNAFIRPGN